MPPSPGSAAPRADEVEDVVAVTMIAGSFTGKRIVDRLPERVFIIVIEGVLVVAGLIFLIGG